MGNPSIKLGDKTIIVDGFFFNVGMTAFREQCEKKTPAFSAESVIPKVAAHIKQRGFEDMRQISLAPAAGQMG